MGQFMRKVVRRGKLGINILSFNIPVIISKAFGPEREPETVEVEVLKA